MKHIAEQFELPFEKPKLFFANYDSAPVFDGPDRSAKKPPLADLNSENAGE